MKKIAIIIFLVNTFLTYSQAISQDSDGYSNLISESSSLNLDVSNQVALFNYVNHYQLKDNHKLLYGIGLSGKSQNGVSVLFSNEKIASDGRIDFLVGKNISVEDGKGYEVEMLKLVTLKTELDSQLEAKLKAYNIFFEDIFSEPSNNELINVLKDNHSIDLNSGQTLSKLNSHLKSIKKKFSEQMDKFERRLIDPSLEDDERTRINNKILKGLAVREKIKTKLNDIINISDKYTNVKNEIKNFVYDVKFRHFLYFLRGGFNGASFKYDFNNGATTIGERFKTKNFNGWQLELGFNLNEGNNNFGLSILNEYMSNLGALEENTYQFSIEDTSIVGGSFTSTESVKAFSGNYDTFFRHSINLEYARLIPIVKKKDGLYLSYNTYMRHRLYSKSDVLKNNTVLGTGLFAVSTKKNKILGGLFVQTNDLFGTHTGDDSTLGKRIAFGLVAKYAFSGVTGGN